MAIKKTLPLKNLQKINTKKSQLGVKLHQLNFSSVLAKTKKNPSYSKPIGKLAAFETEEILLIPPKKFNQCKDESIDFPILANANLSLGISQPKPLDLNPSFQIDQEKLDEINNLIRKIEQSYQSNSSYKYFTFNSGIFAGSHFIVQQQKNNIKLHISQINPKARSLLSENVGFLKDQLKAREIILNKLMFET